MLLLTMIIGTATALAGLLVMFHLTATEALVGLSLITWSASFTYFQMQKAFGNRNP